ncbi:MAG: methyltransferase domain-containing protein [Chlamydiae bacterium]|nr:methyltransferase domain-containing protein [Chlamydiota bacterium]
MYSFLYIIIGLAILGILIGILWRFSSRRWKLPCPTWLSWLVELDNPFTKNNRANTIIEYLDLKSGMNVLDVGCGPGRLTLPISKKIDPKGKVTALDMQQGMLNRVQEKAEATGLQNIHYLHAKIGDGKLEHSQYDRALLVTVLGEIPDQESGLKEIYNSLKPGGILAITEVIFDPHFQRKSRVLQLCKKVGFQVKKNIGNVFSFTLLLEKPL